MPAPSRTLTRIDHYLAERADFGECQVDGVRTWRWQRAESTVHRTTCCVELRSPPVFKPPEGAMAHALRHSYGMTLEVRGVPRPVIQQRLGPVDPRTTSIYTEAHAGALTHTLL